MKTWPLDASRARIYAAVFLFSVAAALRLLVWDEARGTPLDRWHLWDQSDMATYLEQARRLAAGDWLGRKPFYPYHLWQRFAPPEQWERWYPPKVFHQAPAYSYLLGLAQRLAPRPIETVKLLQVLLGAFSCVLLFLIGERWRGRGVGFLAGVILALYGPLIYIELQLLREGIAIFLMLACVLALECALRPSGSVSRQAPLALFGAGVVAGVLSMTHEIGSVIVAAAAASVVSLLAFTDPRRAPLMLGVFVLGYLLGFSPLLLRNLAVGAPPFSVSTRSVVNFVMSNDPGAPGGGAQWGVVGPGFAEIMDRAGGSFPRAAVAVLDSYHGNAALMLSNWLAKARAALTVFEAPDNTSYEFYRSRTAALRPLPGFWLLFAPGLGGAAMAAGDLLAAAKNWKKARESSSAGVGAVPGPQIVLLCFLFALAGSMTLLFSIGRLRLFVVPFLALFASDFLLRFAGGSLGPRRVAPLTVFFAAAAFQVYAQAGVNKRPRPTDFVVAANLEREMGRVAEAARDYASALDIEPLDATVHHALALLLWREGRAGQAIRHLEQGLAIAEGSASAPLKQSLAWMLATCPEDGLRDGSRALALAMEADAITGHQNPAALDALAAAHAELGQFELAQTAARRAADRARSLRLDSLADEIDARARLYAEGKAFRDVRSGPR